MIYFLLIASGVVMGILTEEITCNIKNSLLRNVIAGLIIFSYALICAIVVNYTD